MMTTATTSSGESPLARFEEALKAAVCEGVLPREYASTVQRRAQLEADKRTASARFMASFAAGVRQLIAIGDLVEERDVWRCPEGLLVNVRAASDALFKRRLTSALPRTITIHSRRALGTGVVLGWRRRMTRDGQHLRAVLLAVDLT